MNRFLANKLAVAALLLASCCVLAPASAETPSSTSSATRIIVTIRDQDSALRIEPGATPRLADSQGSYEGSAFARRINRELQREFQLSEETAWRIGLLRVYCVVYRIPAQQDAAELLARLTADARVEAAQLLNEFVTQARTPQFDDPYFGQQTSIAAMHVAEAQRWSAGRGVRIAVIDTAADSRHPELAGRVILSRNLVDADGHTVAAERHGTAVAGAIAAVANNGVGIVGVAPDAQLLLLRACWQPEPAATGRCDSVTLARALELAVERRAHVVNLSLTGPRDALLERLVLAAIARGMVVVGAAGTADEFPGSAAGVIAVMDADQQRAATAANKRIDRVAAPGRNVLTLAPGGRYGHVSGASMSAALTTGVVALILAARDRHHPRRANNALQVLELLHRSSLVADSASGNARQVIDACRAVADRLGRSGCDAVLAARD
jgi:hypothetical protein